MKKQTLIFLFLIPSFLGAEVSIEEYYSNIMAAEQCVLKQEYECADRHYKIAIKANEKPFAYDVLNAIKVNLRTGRNANYLKSLSHHLQVQIGNGFPIEMLLEAHAKKSEFDYLSSYKSLNISQSKSNSNPNKISLSIRKELESIRFFEDSIRKYVDDTYGSTYQMDTVELKLEVFRKANIEVYKMLVNIVEQPRFHQYYLGFRGMDLFKDAMNSFSANEDLCYQFKIKYLEPMVKKGQLSNRDFVRNFDNYFKYTEQNYWLASRPVQKRGELYLTEQLTKETRSIVNSNRQRLFIYEYSKEIEMIKFQERTEWEFNLSINDLGYMNDFFREKTMKEIKSGELIELKF